MMRRRPVESSPGSGPDYLGSPMFKQIIVPLIAYLTRLRFPALFSFKVHPLGHKRLALRRGLQQDLHALPQHDLARRRGGDLGIDLDAPFINQSLEMTAGILGNAGGEVGVQALALGRERNLQAARLGNRAPCPNCVPHHLIDGLVISPIVVGKLGERHGFRQIRLGTGERTGGSRTSRSGHMAIKTGVGAK